MIALARRMVSNHRVVVIGAGVGGLTAAALLARAGFHVTVLEAHIYPGGCAGTFFHKGYRFDAGATVAGGFQPGGPHEMVGRLLNVEWPILRAEPVWVVHLPERALSPVGAMLNVGAQNVTAPCQNYGDSGTYRKGPPMRCGTSPGVYQNGLHPPSVMCCGYQARLALR
jgi:NAD(P)-binding Rossmann-like domain